ncbi:MAG: ABC transporter ATP-binding protein [Clostridia bacterium]|nr:ABC transporter ATP-binding protein [Clostridia bacterium]
MIVEVAGEVLLPKFYANIVNLGVKDGRGPGYIVVAALLMILTAFLMMGGGVGGAYFGAKASVNFSGDLRRDIFARVQEFSFANIDHFATGSLITRMTNDITQMQNFVNMMLRMTLRAPGMLAFALASAIMMNGELAKVLLVTIPLMLCVIAFFIVKAFPRFQTMQGKIDTLNSTIDENLTNVRVVKSFVREDFEKQKFATANGNLKQAGLNAIKLMIFISPLMMLFMNFTVLAVLHFGGQQVIGEIMPIGNLTAFITYIVQILMSLMMTTMLFMNSSRALASAKRIREVLDEELDLTDANAKHPDKLVSKGDIEFKDVTFRYYKNSEGKVLDGLNFHIKAGQTVGIIGSTGCGKTTMVSMIPRLYDVDEGAVLVDGVDVRDYSLKNLREGVGMVLQKNVLFSGTIEENLRWGDENATMDEIRAQAEHAQADQFITSFTNGYDTELGQGGVNVSGGQKQRLCIARALLKKPKILILDDSTSAVDTATEARIRQTFKGELMDSTKLIIAQRITSVMDADQIIVMDDGKITGIGTHDQLMASNKEYQEIYESQMGGKQEVSA